MAGHYGSLIIDLREQIEDMQATQRRRAEADGIWTPDELREAASLRIASGTAERAHEALLDGVSVLMRGELTPRRQRRRRELARDLGPEAA